MHNKISFSDSVRMDRFVSVLDGEAKRAVSAIGQDGLFYASALKLLKREFGNPLMVSYLKLKEVLELPPIQHDDQNSLRNYHQKLKTIVTWLKTMGYDGALKSVENVTKAVMRLPKYLRQKFYRNFKIINYNEREMNLEIFENWLGERIYDMNNPLALIVEIEIKKKQQANKDHQKTTKEKHQRLPKDHYRSFATTTDMEKDRNAESKKNIRCWLCHESHKVSDCQTLKNISVPERRETVKRKGLCFNCLSNTHQISNCKSKVTCKIKGCGKRHNTILHNVSYKPPSNNADSTADNKNKQQQERQQNQQDQQVINSHSRTTSKHLFLQILPVTLKHSNKTVTVDALLDSGSDTTIISENVAQYLGLQGEERQVEIKSALSKTVHFNTKMVSFEIVTDNGNSNMNINAYTASHLDVPTVKYDANEIKNQYQHLRDIPFCDINDNIVGLLIGTNYADLLIHRDFRVGDPGDPIAVKTVLGWMLVGGSKLITSKE